MTSEAMALVYRLQTACSDQEIRPSNSTIGTENPGSNAVSSVSATEKIVVAKADDKKETIKGEVCCAKCELKKQDTCGAVVIVKDGDKEEVYYFDTESQEKFGKECCKEKKMAKVTGTTSEKDGKKWIAVTKVEYEKKD